MLAQRVRGLVPHATWGFWRPTVLPAGMPQPPADTVWAYMPTAGSPLTCTWAWAPLRKDSAEFASPPHMWAAPNRAGSAAAAARALAQGTAGVLSTLSYSTVIKPMPCCQSACESRL